MTDLFTAANPRVMRLTVPMPPNIANGRMHHMVKHNVKVSYWAVLDLHLIGRTELKALEQLKKMREREQRKGSALGRELEAVERFAFPLSPELRFPKKPEPIDRAAVRSTMYLGAAMDDGNAMNRHKWVEDWLVTRGFLADDRRKCLRWEGLPTQIVKRDGNYRIELVLTEELE